jgi:hypothetical protein
MPHTPRPHPPAPRHGALTEVLPDLFVVSGGMKMPTALPVRFSRNMQVVREGERLVLVNTVRLDDAGLAELDKLGKVTDVIRVAGNHGSDDPFYAERYGAKVWVVKGQRYTAGFNTNRPDTYFTPHHEMDATTTLPLANAKVYVLDGKPTEGLLHLAVHAGVVISGDSMQNWAATDEYFNGVAKVMMKLGGFIKPHNVGPAWLKQTKPPKEQLRGILDLEFANVLPAHGTPVIGDARERYRAALERVSA